jgi:hypothetical protein
MGLGVTEIKALDGCLIYQGLPRMLKGPRNFRLDVMKSKREQTLN